MLLLGISPKTDTYHNIKKNHHFVIGIPNRKILNQLYQAGTAYGPDVNEFEITGLTPGDGSIVQAKLIMECEINFECIMTWENETGDHMTVYGEVARIHQKENPTTMDADVVIVLQWGFRISYLSKLKHSSNKKEPKWLLFNILITTRSNETIHDGNSNAFFFYAFNQDLRGFFMVYFAK